MKKILCILLAILLLTAGFMTIEYMGAGSYIDAWADSAEGEGELYIFSGTFPGEQYGLKPLPYDMLMFEGEDLYEEIRWYFTPEEEKILSVMTLEQKIGQMFIVRPESLKGKTSMTDAMRTAIGEKTPGGVILFADNIENPKQIRSFNEEIRKCSLESSKVPMFIGIDEEGGLVARIGNNKNFDVQRYDSMLDIGKTGDTGQAKLVGETIGGYLADNGFDLDFAPVADCFTNPNNTVIGDRAFGSDPDQVSEMVAACIDGLHSQGIMAVIKHYPGHGDTDSDTHSGAAVTKRTWKELKERELISFIRNFTNTDMIMTSHIICSKVTRDKTPATLSKIMIREKLREELGYDGVVITDSMEMGAISSFYEYDEAAIKAIEAGCDIILCPGDFDAAYDGLLKAVREGRISEQRIDESVLRILRLKLKYEEDQ